VDLAKLNINLSGLFAVSESWSHIASAMKAVDCSSLNGPLR
jgi:hypothetical protein